MKALIFVYGMTAFGAFVSLFDPFYGLLVYVCFAIIRPDFMWRWTIGQTADNRFSFIVGSALIFAGWCMAWAPGSWAGPGGRCCS